MKTIAFSLFTLMIGLSSHAKVAERQSFIVKNTKELKALEAKMKKSGGEEKAWLRWQLALNAPLVGNAKLGLAALDSLITSRQKLIAVDQIDLTRARIHFQEGNFEDAIDAYQAVGKASEYWFEALEEEAWSYIRLGQPDKATAKLATLLSPVFQTWVGPETFFAANYTALKTCDYPTVFKYGKQFKERHMKRIKELESLSKTGNNSVTSTALARLESGEMNFTAFAKEATAMPRFFWRDEFLRRHVADIKDGKASPKNAAKARSKMVARLKALAKSELSEYKTVIQKLHIIEAEAIQRMYLDDSLTGVRPELAETKSDPNVLSFPHDDEMWIDEIDSYQAKVKECPQLKEAKYDVKSNN